MFQQFQSFIPKIANQLNIAKQTKASHACHVARLVLENSYPDLNQYIKIISFQDSTFKLQISNSTIANEFRYIQEEFLSKTNDHFKQKQSNINATKIIFQN